MSDNSAGPVADPVADPLVGRLRAAGCVFAEDEAALLRSALAGDALADGVRRRVAGEPLEWIVGRVSFAGHDYRVSPGVFIPRQRSLALVEAAELGAPSEPVIVELCCGCAALGLAVQARIGGTLIASDIDPRAVADARTNGAAAEVGDLFDAVPEELRGRVDVLICNAPYVPTAEIDLMPRDSREHEDGHLVDGGSDGLDVLRRVVEQAPTWLAPRGRLFVEAAPAQAEQLRRFAGSVGLRVGSLVITG